MAKQTVNPGTAPTGIGGDTFRSGSAKLQANDDEIYAAFGATAQGVLPAALPVYRGGTGAETVAAARTNLALDRFNQSTLSTEIASGNGNMQIILTNDDFYIWRLNALPNHISFRTNVNTTVDANGFIKAASPIVQLFADKITANDEAKLQEITFEKLGVGDYLVKGSLGFAQESWYVETPKDANGNVLFSVLYDTLENGDISVKTYKKKFDLETASIVADLDKPVDITTGRWIDIRLQQLPQPEINHEDLVFESATPAEFQPTNLAQAVAEAFSNGTEQ